MKGAVLEVVSGIFVLIGIYLFVANSSETVAIINALFKNSVSGIIALQGRK
jgi:multisubunit Na+/H+ antiporter MnhC subunit